MGIKDSRKALIVLGMHRSGTSAMAGLLGEMGCDLPDDLMAPKDMNAKGFFESNKITNVNEELLASAGMTWFDLNRFPETWYASPKAPEFRQRASVAVQEEFGTSGLFVMKDPRQCRLVPFWEDTLIGLGVQPVYVCIHRNPVEVAASLMRWAGYEPLYGQMLWLRHVLDAEFATRGKPRVFVSYDQVLSDWRAVVNRIAEALDLVFPRSVQTAARGVERFLSADLKHQSSEDLTVPRLEDTSDWLAVTSEVLSRWSLTGEDRSDHATLDRIRAAMDGSTATVVTLSDELLARHQEIERLRSEQTEVSVRVLSLSAEVEAQRQSIAEMELSFRNQLGQKSTELVETRTALADRDDRIAQQTAELDKARAELDKAGTKLADWDYRIAQHSADLEETRTALANSEATLSMVRDTLHLTWLQTQSLQSDLNTRALELHKARSRPLGNIRSFVEFRALNLLARKRSPLPRKIKARFRRSADKRNPARGLPEFTSQVAMTRNDADNVLSTEGKIAFRPGLPSVIVVTHDVSRTGAPILALNMARALSARYNVVTVCLRGGPLFADFQEVSTTVYLAEGSHAHETRFDRMLDEISAQEMPAFAVVNCIESRHILHALRQRQIPSVALFHEFASYTLPKSAFAEAFHLADEVVFSSELTIRNAMEQTSFLRSPRFHVLAQGRCDVPRHEGEEVLRESERERLTGQLRPNGVRAAEFLVIGAGYVQMRKGVDLFIDVARRVLSTEDGRNARFAWIGAGYDPERDAAYSVYLKDQIDRAGLTDRMMMLGETSEIEHVYALSNLLLLSSRLDPLPNVALDALTEGMPVVCFEKTTGVADLLTDAGLHDHCVADFLDTAQAADLVLRFIREPVVYRQVCDRSKAYAKRVFDFDAYAQRIEELGLGVRKGLSLRSKEVDEIAEAEGFDPAYMMPVQRHGATRLDAATFYVTENWRTTPSRRPEPGFNPLTYSRHLTATAASTGDPYATFLRNGRPAGPWLRSVIRESDSADLPDGKPRLRTALHIHAYYPDTMASIAKRLAANETQPDLFINAGDRKSLDAAVQQLDGYRGRIAEARVVVNRGRDIGPFLTEYGPELVRDYDLIGHVHTKKSALLSNRGFVDRWVNFLYENMIGGEKGGAMMDRILAAFTQNERLGVVFPADPNIMAWSGNEDIARRLAPRLGIDTLPEFFDFPIGSMLWMRAAALQPFVELGLDWHDYPPEPVGIDGTILHALERMFGLVAESRGLDVAVTNVKGVSR